jgi:hypothetical protein
LSVLLSANIAQRFFRKIECYRHKRRSSAYRLSFPLPVNL